MKPLNLARAALALFALTSANAFGQATVSLTSTPTSITEAGGTLTHTGRINNNANSVMIINSVQLIGGQTPTFNGCVPTPIPVGSFANCTFSQTVGATDSTGTPILERTFRAELEPLNGGTFTREAEDTVQVTNSNPALEVRVTSPTTEILEGGQSVVINLAIDNTSVGGDTVTLTALTFNNVSLLTAGAACAGISRTIARGQTRTCQFNFNVIADAVNGDRSINASATARDEENNAASDTTPITFDVTNHVPSARLDVSASPASVGEPSGQSELRFTVANLSDREAIQLAALIRLDTNQDVLRTVCGTATVVVPINGEFACPSPLPVTVVGEPGAPTTFAFRVETRDNENTLVSDNGEAVVLIINQPPEPSVTVTGPGRVDEPGGSLAYVANVTNEGFEPICLTRITQRNETAEERAAKAIPERDLLPVCAPSASCSIPGVGVQPGVRLDPAQAFSCGFDLSVTGDAGDSEAFSIDVEARDNDASVAADSSNVIEIDIDDVAPALGLTAGPNPAQVVAPGSAVSFTVGVRNESAAESVDVERVEVERQRWIAGGVAPIDTTVIDLSTVPACQALPQVYGPGIGGTCLFADDVFGQEGDFSVYVFRAAGSDNETNVAQATSSTTINVVGAGVPLAPNVDFSVSPTNLLEPGGLATYRLQVRNDGTRTFRIAALTEVADPPLLISGRGSCAVGANLASTEVYSCDFETQVVGAAGDTLSTVALVAVEATDASGDTLGRSDSATVTITAELPDDLFRNGFEN